MARGWESKSVEAQMETSERDQAGGRGRWRSPEEVVLLGRKEGLMLSRIRVTKDLERARSPRHRKILEDALSHLERELAGLDQRLKNLP